MIRQEFAIPQTQYNPDSSQNQDYNSRPQAISVSPIVDPVVMHQNYVHQVEANHELKRQYDDRQEILSIHRRLEQVRDAKINDMKLNTRRRKLGAFMDYIVLGRPLGADTEQAAMYLNKLIDTEAEVGGAMFSTDPAHLHYFHYHDNDEWFWYVENSLGEQQTVRYVVKELDGIVRSVNGQGFEELSHDEHEKFLIATKLYGERVLSSIYGRQDLA